MSQAQSPCVPCCDSTNTVNVPGSAGQSAYTTTVDEILVPAPNVSVGSIQMGNTDWMAVGNVYLLSEDNIYGHFRVTAISDSTHATLTFLNYTGDAAAATTIDAGARVVASGTQPADLTTTELKALNTTLLAGITALTDNSTGTASNTIAAGAGVHTWVFETRLIDLTAATLVNFVPGFAFKVLAMSFCVEVAATTISKAATLTPQVNGVNTTGGVLSLTSANCTPVGASVSATTITGSNTGTNAQAFTIVGSGITAFAEGSGFIVVRVQNMDTANAIASLSDHVNDILSQLQT